MTSAPAIGFEFRPSSMLLALRLSVAALALLAIVLAGIPVWLKLVLIAAVLGAQGWAVHRRGTLQPAAAGWSPEAGWSVRLCDGRDLPAALLPSRALGSAVLLNLRTGPRQRHALWLLPDNSDADTRRRLRMRLGLMQHPDEASAD